MSGISFNVALVDNEAQRNIRNLIAILANRQPFFAAVGEHIVGETGRRFRTETGPDGQPWEPLKPSTVKKRAKRRRSAIKILRERGYLAGSINYAATNDEVRIGSPVEYAAIHQLGGTIDMPAREQTLYFKRNRKGDVGRRFVAKKKANHTVTAQRSSHQITIPARPFLGVTAADEAEIADIAERWLNPPAQPRIKF